VRCRQASNACAGEETTREIRHICLFVGADPATDWLKDCGVAVDKAGFIITGAAASGSDAPVVHALESSVPGVFAVGDVRSGSVKRVGAAIGEGAQVVQALHRSLESADKPSP
jgi:thioredoxin reductase (NADPH)